ncbi:glycosyl transferase, group 2 family [Rhodovulum sp. P5]|uniref:glycosyltransferase family 2 protein n=1 Tax=Rhodovulum sp. P5 TaxID=1564506 RepID=UPI0009C27314|nr:glycosyltransferase [Rhodovulum sp. P5]ARE41817.1 glycosyl transferase, group 2 family [Rhodovulum sp. P5]
MDGARALGLPSVSVVIPALSEGENLIDTVASVRAHSGPLDPQVIVVDDGSTDGAPQRTAARFADDPQVRVIHGPGEGIARARNAGAAVAEGEAIVFLDGHCYVPDGWLAPLVAPLADEAVGLSGPAFTSIRDHRLVACGITWEDEGLGNVWLPAGTRGPVPFHIGACQAVRADAFAALGGFDPGMTRWGSEDIEICLRMWLMGYEVHAAPQSLVYHLFRTSRPYDVDPALILYNHLRLAMLHFDEARLERILARIIRCPGAEKCLARALTDGLWSKREEMQRARVRDLDWFLTRFGIGF